MINYYFTYWIQEYGSKNFINLTNKVFSNTVFDGTIKKFSMADDWLFVYFFAVYYTVALHYFGLNANEINLCLDIIIAPGWHKLFNSEELLKKHSDVIPEIEEYIKKDFEKNIG